jgi:hypothetical protein
MSDPNGPFAVAAGLMRRHGLAPLALGGDDGKRPLLKGFDHWRFAPTERTLAKLTHRFGNANVGAVCAPSGIVVIDLDDRSILDITEERLGKSPLMVDTPGGGVHLYYRNPEGIGCVNLRAAGIQGDVKGRGGVVVCPPSRNPATGNDYRFRQGWWSAVPHAPTLTRQALAAFAPAAFRSVDRHAALNPIGARNKGLFDHLRHLAPWNTLEEVIAEAHWYNRTQNVEPEENAKVTATARQVWKYQHNGSVRSSRAFVALDHADLDALKEVAGRD